MPNIRISDMALASLPLVGDELIETVQGGFSRQTTVDDIIAAAAALDATFVTVTANPNLANERILTGGTRITLVDGGAGNPITIDGDVPPGGDLPLPTVLNSMLISDGAAFWNEATNLTYDNAAALLQIDVGGGSANVSLSHDGLRAILATGDVSGGDLHLLPTTEILWVGDGTQLRISNTGDAEYVTLRTIGTNFIEEAQSGLLTRELGTSGRPYTTVNVYGRIIANGNGAVEGPLNLPIQVAPTTPLDGDIWHETAGFFGQVGGSAVPFGSATPILQYSWLFDTATAQADPGTNTLRFNNATPASITFIYIDDTGPDGQDLGSLIVSNLTDGYQLEIADPTDADTIQRFLVTGPPTDFTGFWRIPVVNLSAQSGSAIPANGADIEIRFDFQQFLGQGTLSGNSKDILFWDGNGWNNSGATIRVNQNRPAIGGAIALSGSSSVDRTTAMLNVQVGNASSALWFMAGAVSTDGGWCFGSFTGTQTISWGWDESAVVTTIFSMDQNLRFVVAALAGSFWAEKAADHGNIAGFGEVWVRNDVPNTLMFTDDAGNDHAIAGTGAGVTSFEGRTGVVVGVRQDYDGVGLQFDDSVSLQLGSGNDVTIQFDGTGGSMGGPGGGATFNVSGFAQFRVAESLGINEAAAPDGDVATVGQVWVLNAAPNRLQFTGDTGIDMDLTTSLYTVAGALTLSVEAAGGLVNLRGADNLDTSQRILQFTHLDGSIRGSIGQTAAVNDMRITNSVTNGAFEILLGGTGMYRIEPDPNTAFDLTRHDFTDDNGNTTFTIGVVGVTDVQMGAQVADADGTLRPVGMHIMPPITQNAAITFDAADFGRMFIHDEATTRIWTIDQLTDVPIGAIIGAININGTGTITLDPGAGVAFEWWDGSAFQNSTANRTLGEGQFTFYKRSDIEYVITGPNIT